MSKFKLYFYQFTPETTLVTVLMDEHLESDNMSEGNAIVRVQMKETNNGEKPNKCNQCDYASNHAGNLRDHLKTHSGEKPHKCNQCKYASSQATNLRRHLKMHSGEK